MNQVAPQPKIIDLGEERPGANAVTAVEQSRAMQEATASILAAKRFPRDEVLAEKKILAACMRPGLAAVATYAYSRGGSKVEGPSIRLAEALKQYWGNIDSGWRELERRGNESIVEAYAWDKETNTRAQRVFTVKQLRDKKETVTIEGKKVERRVQVPLTDERDIYENNANQAARRMRACILELIPGDIVEAAVEQCAKTLEAKEPNTPETRAAMVKAFAENHGVTLAMLEKYIGRSLESISGAQIVKLRSIYNSLQDEMSKPGDWFDTSLAAEKNDEPKKEEPKKAEDKAPEQKAEEKKTLDDLKAQKEQKSMDEKLKAAEASIDQSKKK